MSDPATPTLEELSARALLIQLQGGSGQALVELHSQYAARLLRQAMRFGLRFEDAEEVVYDTFCRIYYGIAAYSSGSGEALGWMLTINRNVVLDRFKHSGRMIRSGSTVSLDESYIEGYSGEIDLEDQIELDCRMQADESAWIALSSDEHKVIMKGRGPGRGRAEYFEASNKYHRFHSIYYDLCVGEHS